jgi:ATP-dependent metalloprotease FtsH
MKNQNTNDINLRLMMLSAGILIILFLYTIIRNSLPSDTYMSGLIFLAVLLILAFILKINSKNSQKYDTKDFIDSFWKTSKNQNQNQQNQQKQYNHNMTNSLSSNYDQLISPSSSNTTFKDVAGLDEVKESLSEIIDFLKNSSKFDKFGVKLPRGVLLVGSPGVGKTLVAKAVAGEADVPFYYQSGASFVQIYVGMGAKRVKELFNEAKKNAPSIIFIDEIDAVAKKRTGNRNDEREATLNELLMQMDGFEDNNGVIIIGATNNIDILDDAILRAGRFDRQIHIELPKYEDRLKILEAHLKNKPNSVDVKSLAKQTASFSSSALATVINESALDAIRNDDDEITDININRVKNRVKYGTFQDRMLDQKEKEVLSLYQSTKAYYALKYNANQDELGLFDNSLKEFDKNYESKNELINKIKLYLSGSVAVEIVNGEPYNVNSADILSAKKLANDIIIKYSMGNSIIGSQDDVSNLLNTIKAELQREITSQKDSFIELENRMIINETITNEDIDEVF